MSPWDVQDEQQHTYGHNTSRWKAAVEKYHLTTPSFSRNDGYLHKLGLRPHNGGLVLLLISASARRLGRCECWMARKEGFFSSYNMK